MLTSYKASTRTVSLYEIKKPIDNNSNTLGNNLHQHNTTRCQLTLMSSEDKYAAQCECL